MSRRGRASWWCSVGEWAGEVVGVGSDAASAGRQPRRARSGVGRVARLAADRGRLSVELDVWDWTPGQDFVARMEQALASADRVLVVWSEAYFRSTFGRAE